MSVPSIKSGRSSIVARLPRGSQGESWRRTDWRRRPRMSGGGPGAHGHGELRSTWLKRLRPDLYHARFRPANRRFMPLFQALRYSNKTQDAKAKYPDSPWVEGLPNVA